MNQTLFDDVVQVLTAECGCFMTVGSLPLFTQGYRLAHLALCGEGDKERRR